MSFVSKHLPDKFYMEGDQRISLRTKIFREVVANLIVHREYTNAHPCTFIIYADSVVSENANNPHGNGPIDPNNFAPFPKNPTIAKLFIQLGRVDELGSGVLNVNRLIKEYTDKGTVQFIEGVTFKTIVPVGSNDLEGIGGAIGGAIGGVIGGVIEGATTGVKEKLSKLIAAIYANEGKKTPDLIKVVKVSERSIERYLKQLRDAGLIEFKGDSALIGGYYLTEKMKSKLK